MANDTKKKSAKVRLEDAFTPKASISKKAYALLAVLSFVLIFLYWAYAVYVKHVDSMFLPSPAKTFESAKNMFLTGGFLTDIRMSVQRIDWIFNFSSGRYSTWPADRNLCTVCCIFRTIFLIFPLPSGIRVYSAVYFMDRNRRIFESGDHYCRKRCTDHFNGCDECKKCEHFPD